MIRIRFCRRGGEIVGFRVKGHAGFAESGQDIVCASVTSAVQMAANGLTECAGLPADLSVHEGDISLRCEGGGEGANLLFESLYLQLSLLAQDYPKNIVITDTEV